MSRQTTWVLTGALSIVALGGGTAVVAAMGQSTDQDFGPAVEVSPTAEPTTTSSSQSPSPTQQATAEQTTPQATAEHTTTRQASQAPSPQTISPVSPESWSAPSTWSPTTPPSWSAPSSPSS